MNLGADNIRPGLLTGGPFHGRELTRVRLTVTTRQPPAVLNVAPPPLFPTGRIPAGPRPPWWRRGHWSWQPTEPAPLEFARPPLQYRYAGELDDGTLVYRFDADASYPQIGETSLV